jgi:putative DNA-invertase from lambdoid prophage Rac
MRVAVYFRVSTEDQTTEPQRLELLEYCNRRGWEDVTEFRDVISGAKSSRDGLDVMMEGIRKHKVDVVVCVKMDRLGRSLTHLAQMLGEMNDHGVALIATSQGIDTSASNPAAKLQLHVLMAVAEFEREIILERTLAGLAAAKIRLAKIGRKLGRVARKWTEEERDLIQTWDGTVVGLARELKCSVGTAHSTLKRCVPVEGA